MSLIKKAVFPVAGFGTRFLPFSKSVPKEMLPLIDKPIIQLLVEEAIDCGIEQIIFIISRGKEALQNHFNKNFELEELLKKKGKKEIINQLKKIENSADFIFMRQDAPRGCGDAVLKAEKIIGNDNFAIIFGDDLVYPSSLKQIIKTFQEKSANTIAIKEIPPKDVHKFGIVKPKKLASTFEIESLVEKPSIAEAPSNLAIIGKYICTPNIFQALKECSLSNDGELRLIDGFLQIQKKEKIFGKIIKGKRFDLGNKLDFLKALVFEGLNRPEFKKDFLDFLKQELSH